MSHKRNVYLNMKSLDEARSLVLDTFGQGASPGVTIVPTAQAVGRILAGPVTARCSSPSFHAAAMDGIAVDAKATFGAHASRPMALRIGKDAFYVNTGNVLPDGVDAVIMIEQVQVLDDQTAQIEAPAFPWQHVRKMGEDIVATELLFARHHRVTPYCVGALLAAGRFEVEVLQRPKVVIIPTGSELVEWQSVTLEQIKPGQVIESNATMLAAMVEAAGGRCDRRSTVGDDPEAIQDAVRQAAAESGVMAVLLTGGSSAGSEDFARSAIAESGEVLVHGVTMMPGKPVIVGDVLSTPVFGIPGYPVSAIMAFEQLVHPLIAHWLGQPAPQRELVPVTPTRKIASKLGVEEFVRVKIGRVGQRLVAAPLPRGAGQITSITEADGIIRIPASLEGIDTDIPVNAELLRPAREVEHTIVVVGSHDNTLDLLADEIKIWDPRLTLSSSHVGSMGGLMAVRRGVCHVAGTHLLNEDDGTYNVSYVQDHLTGMDIRLLHLVMRDQGLMVSPGNPKQIADMADLAREDVCMINRQAGSGTRILLDYRLKQQGIDPGTIKGYHEEEYTHMAIAAAVLSGAADVGLGIQAAAKALGLDFIPVVTEQYDLIIPAEYFDSGPIVSLRRAICSATFQKRVLALGGYHTERTGEVLM